MIDKFITVLFIQSILFSFYLGQILSAVRLKIYRPRTKFVKSRQTICTCKMLMMTENNLFASARLLLIVLALFRHYLASRAFFLHFIPKSTASIILNFRLIVCIILCKKAQSNFINVVQSLILPSF